MRSNKEKRQAGDSFAQLSSGHHPNAEEAIGRYGKLQFHDRCVDKRVQQSTTVDLKDNRIQQELDRFEEFLDIAPEAYAHHSLEARQEFLGDRKLEAVEKVPEEVPWSHWGHNHLIPRGCFLAEKLPILN